MAKGLWLRWSVGTMNGGEKRKKIVVSCLHELLDTFEALSLLAWAPLILNSQCAYLLWKEEMFYFVGT